MALEKLLTVKEIIMDEDERKELEKFRKKKEGVIQVLIVITLLLVIGLPFPQNIISPLAMWFLAWWIYHAND